MGTYLNVEAVEEMPRLETVGTFRVSLAYAMYKSQAAGRHMVAVCDRLMFKIAVLVDDYAEFEEFFQQYREGSLVSFHVYAVDSEFIKLARNTQQ